MVSFFEKWIKPLYRLLSVTTIIVANLFAYEDSMGRKFLQKLSTNPSLSSLQIHLLYESSMGADIVAKIWAYKDSMGADIVAKIWAYKDSTGADIVAKIWAYKDSMGRKFHQKLSTKPYVVVFRVPKLCFHRCDFSCDFIRLIIPFLKDIQLHHWVSFFRYYLFLHKKEQCLWHYSKLKITL